MASEKTINGNYGGHQPYPQAEPFLPSQGSNVSSGPAAGDYGDEASAAPTAAPAEPAGAVDGKPFSKDEVGWYFVESYYTTLSKNPETLHLYYNKRSQFVSGNEAEKVDVSVGQRAINDRIKKLDFQDCKVRVSNVDSQESFNNIVVQVIGEISNKAAAHRKFVQTFVLAEQPKGYFVLNDIFRYIVEDEEEELEHGQAASQEVAPTLAAESEAATLTSSADLVQQEHDAEQVDKKIEVEVLQKPSAADEGSSDVSPANGYAAPDAVEISHAEDVPTAAMDEPEEALAPDQAAEATAVEQATQPEKPQDHDPTAVASPPKSTHATPVEAAAAVAPPKPAAPKTWAHLVAANRVAAPVVPNGASTNKPTSTPAPTAIKAAPSSTNLSATPPTSSSEETSAKNQQPGNAGWQMAGSDNNKKQGRQHAQSVSETHQNVLGYVKNVTDKVDASILKKTLLQYGELVYFDVSRPKNCAFVEFADSAAYNAAVADNPHSIGGEQIFVEERRPRANAYGGNFAGRGGIRGGRGGNEGRPASQGRGGYPKEGGRGGYVPRGRGGNMVPRGRGQPQAA